MTDFNARLRAAGDALAIATLADATSSEADVAAAKARLGRSSKEPTQGEIDSMPDEAFELYDAVVSAVVSWGTPAGKSHLDRARALLADL